MATYDRTIFDGLDEGCLLVGLGNLAHRMEKDSLNLVLEMHNPELGFDVDRDHDLDEVYAANVELTEVDGSGKPLREIHLSFKRGSDNRYALYFRECDVRGEVIPSQPWRVFNDRGQFSPKFINRFRKKSKE